MSISLLVLFLLTLSLMGLNGCDRQVHPLKVVKELLPTPEAAVGGMLRSAIEKVKEVETTLGGAGKLAANTSKE